MTGGLPRELAAWGVRVEQGQRAGCRAGFPPPTDTASHRPPAQLALARYGREYLMTKGRGGRDLGWEFPH